MISARSIVADLAKCVLSLYHSQKIKLLGGNPRRHVHAMQDIGGVLVHIDIEIFTNQESP